MRRFQYAILKSAIFAIISILMGILSFEPAFGQTCKQVLLNEIRPEDYARRVQGDFLMFMRSNPKWSWGWFRANQGQYSRRLEEVASYHGVVGGDVKPDNIDLVEDEDGNVKLGLIDFDDGGNGSFVGDLVHTLSYNDIWPESISREEALKWYQEGLLKSDKKDDLISLKKIFKVFSGKKGKKKHKKDLAKMVASEDYFYEHLQVEKLSQMSPDVKSMYALAEPKFRRILNGFGEVLRFGVRVKKDGGSMGAPRYVYLVNTEDGPVVYEFKYQPGSAVEAGGRRQWRHDTRINDLIETQRPLGDEGNIKMVAQTRAGYFLVRERVHANFDAEEAARSPELIPYNQDYIRHMFYWMGKRHRKQNKAYAKDFIENITDIKQDLNRMVTDHINASKDIFDSYNHNN